MTIPEYGIDDIEEEAGAGPEPRPDLRVGFVLMNQFTLVPVAGLVDSLRFAADKSFRSRQIYCQWDWMTCDDQAVTASCGMPILPTRHISLLDSGYDYIVLAGGLLGETRNPSEWLVEELRKVRAAHIPIIALCSASFVLARAGLLDGRRCAVHFTVRDEFVERFPQVKAVVDQSYIDDDGLITCPGGTAIDLAASMIRRHCGEVRAQKGLRYLLVEGAGMVARPHDDGVEAGAVYQNDMIAKAIDFMRLHLDAPLSLKEIAEHVGTSARQLNRAFLQSTNDSPANYWRRIRLEHARRKLAGTNLPVTTIALQYGFSDASHFIMWFRKLYGETPASYRKRRHAVERLIASPRVQRTR